MLARAGPSGHPAWRIPLRPCAREGSGGRTEDRSVPCGVACGNGRLRGRGPLEELGGEAMGVRVAIAGGGTGGHVFPALAVIEELLDVIAREDILFIGARGGIEERIMPAHEVRSEFLPSIKGLFGPSMPLKAAGALRGFFRARALLSAFGARAVLGTGGYASALPVLAARSLTIPAILLEQNAIPGRTNRLLSRFAWEVGVQFEESAGFFPKPHKVVATGNPLRRSLRTCADGVWERTRGGRPGRRLLVLGGSQGARNLNDLLLRALMDLRMRVPGIEVFLIAGERDEARAREAFQRSRVKGKVVGFTEDMAMFYAAADLVLCRAGATTLAELAAFGLPSILVPYPYAADNHQEANARVYEKAGAARIMRESDATPASLSLAIAEILGDGDRLKAMAMAAKGLDRPGSAREVAGRLIRAAGAEGIAWPETSLAMTARIVAFR
ncbi:MAG: undecaprenyldiphospho-muramoylpentapeptide beta-N-acetylglucosaminyltransferase [Planctomycetota bacterium]|nr:undecaprenyldiphospho-muramoylpentapeptide beta-N-acetylglucosaminyltransferase [Planctomycetota bacterium]